MKIFLIVFLVILNLFVVSNSFADKNIPISAEDAVKIALENNASVLAAKNELEAAKGRHMKSGTIADPELSFEWSAIPQGKSFGDAEERKIGVSQSLEFPSKYFLKSGAADKEVKIAEEKLQRIKSLVSADVKKAYHKTILLQKVSLNIEANIDLLKQFLESINIRFQSGSVPYLEIVRAKVESAKIKNELIEAKRELSAQKREFNLLLGRMPNEPVELSADLVYKPFNDNLPGVIDKCLGLNSTFKIKKLQLEQNQLGLSLANAGFIPDFNFGIFSHRFGGIESQDGLAVEFSMSIPLWFLWKQNGEVKEASSNAALSQVILDFTGRNIRTEIENSYEAVKTAEEQVKNFESSILLEIEDELKSGITSYQNGKIDTLNLMDIYKTYKNTKIEYYRSLYNYYVALIDLEISGEERE